MLPDFKILYHQGKQFIPDVTTVEVPGIFRGRPEISDVEVDTEKLVGLCPTRAISANPVCIDLGKCLFCGECARVFPGKISFTKDYKIATNSRSGLVVSEGNNSPVVMDPKLIRKEITKLFSGSLKLRQVSAGGDSSCEWELGATGNVNFDMERFGIEFVASPRHADGIVITGPITESMAEPLQMCYDAMPDPKIIVLVGTDAISGGMFADSPEINRSFLDKYPVDLYIPGNPAHPLTIINGFLDLTRKQKK
jgi:Ni,Fe-hydrogenase III small subunit